MEIEKLKEKIITPLFVVITAEIAGIILMMLGVLPREVALFLLGTFVFFILFSPLKHGLLFAVFSIPFFTALPISESFDMMASWRIIILVLFLKAILNFLPEARPGRLIAHAFRNLEGSLTQLLKTRLGLLVGLFFLIAVLSLFVAQDLTFGVRKLIYLANILGLFFVIWAVVRTKDDFLDVARYTFAGVVGALVVGYVQFATILFVPLYSFWQWWAHNITPLFYGAKLGDLLAYSNTWFSYYEDAEPTLRVFSLFPDSHSFALFMILGLPIALLFFLMHRKNLVSTEGKFSFTKPLKLNYIGLFLGSFIVLALLAIIFSGTRGAWVGAVPVFFLLLVMLGIFRLQKGTISLGLDKEKLLPVVKTSIFVFLVFALLFPVSSQILKFSQSRQGGKVSGTTFERISKSLSREELSNLGRIQIWKSTIRSVAQHPLLGVGIGNYPVVLGENASATKKGASAHSLYLDVIAEMGVLGGILLILIFLEILWRAVRVASTHKDVFLASFGGFLAVYFLWLMSYSVVDVVLLNDKVLLLFVTLVGLLYSIPKSSKLGY